MKQSVIISTYKHRAEQANRAIRDEVAASRRVGYPDGIHKRLYQFVNLNGGLAANHWSSRMP